MASGSFDIVVLSSSPAENAGAAPRAPSPSSPFKERVGMPATSTLSLSPASSPKKKTSSALRSGSRAVPVPVEAVRGFATARSLVQSEHFSINIDDDDSARVESAPQLSESIGGQGEQVELVKKPRKRPTKAAATGSDVEKPKPKPRARKPKADKAPSAPAAKPAPAATTSPYFDTAAPIEPVEQPTEPKTTKSGKLRKPRKKKDNAENGHAQCTLKAKVTKPRRATSSGKTSQRKGTAISSAHVQAAEHEIGDGAVASASDRVTNGVENKRDTSGDSIRDMPMGYPDNNSPPKQRPPDERYQLLDLEEALARRRDWTPPLDTKCDGTEADSASKENNISVARAGNGSFTSLLSGYSYAHMDLTSDGTTSKPAAMDGGGTMKRRRVELVDVPGNQTSPVKSKAPKKKPRTITDLVTGQYASILHEVDNGSNSEPPAVTSTFFTSCTSVTTKVPLNDINTADAGSSSKKPRRNRATSKTSTENAEATSKPKKSTKSNAKSNAKPKMVADKLLSPSSAVLKMNKQDLMFGTSSQLALDESPTMVREIQRAIVESEQDAELRQRLAPEVMRARPWSRLEKMEGKRGLWAASNRDDEGHMLEREDVYMPSPDRTQDFPLLMDGTHEDPGNDTSFVDIDDFPLSAPISNTISSDLPTPPPTVSENLTDRATEEAVKDSFLDIDDFPQELPPSNPNLESSFLDIDDFPPSAQRAAEPPMPTSFGSPVGSPKKRRGRPPKDQSAIAQQVAMPAPATKKNLPAGHQQASTIAPCTPKHKHSRFVDIEEILDSEDDEALSPTPPRVRKLEDSPPLQFTSAPAAPTEGISLVPVFRILESQLLWVNTKDAIFARITSAIRALPPTTNPAHPSWHEKILMYDPIILEDFTAFINTQTTIRTYKRATQKQVKAWNKELKKKGEAKLQADEDGGEVLAVEKELETWMVQKWCEEMSICCVMKEGRGRGSVRGGLY